MGNWTGRTEFVNKQKGWQTERGKDGTRRRNIEGKPGTTVTTLGESDQSVKMEALGMMPGMLVREEQMLSGQALEDINRKRSVLRLGEQKWGEKTGKTGTYGGGSCAENKGRWDCIGR